MEGISWQQTLKGFLFNKTTEKTSVPLKANHSDLWTTPGNHLNTLESWQRSPRERVQTVLKDDMGAPTGPKVPILALRRAE